MHLTAAQREQYEQNGFLVVETLLEPAEVQRLLARLDRVIADGGRPAAIRVQVEPGLAGSPEAQGARADSIRKVEGLAEHDPVFHSLARDPRLLRVFRDLLGPDLKLFRDALMMKPARHGSAKPYHQDSAYWAIEPPALASCWLALDPATTENGCMRVLPGSHRWGALEHQHLADYQVDEAGLDTAGEVSVPLSAGGALFFHSMLLHATAPNASPRPRRAMILSLMSARSRWVGERSAKPEFPLLSGREFPGCV
jgi:phytanoyl-CoA hydroxylase